jgi:HlyD family secretion protein
MDRSLPKRKWYEKQSVRITIGVCALIVILYVLIFRSLLAGTRVSENAVTIATVTEGEFQELIPATGIVQPIRSIYLDAVEGGRVAEIFVEDGQTVQEGQPIVRMENTNLVLDVMYREAQLFEQSNNLRNTRLAMEQRSLDLKMQIADIELQTANQKREAALAETLHTKGLIPEQKYYEVKDQNGYLSRRLELTVQNARQDSIFRSEQLKQLEESVQRLASNLEIIRRNQEQLVVRAPVTGQISALSVEIGQTKTPGQRLGQIDVLDSYKIRASVDEHYVARVSIGKTGDFNLNNKDWKLEVSKIYPEVRNGQFEVDLAFVEGTPEGIRRGQSVRLRLALGEPGQALMVERGGFYTSTGGQWIYVLDKNGKNAVKRTIKLGRQNPQVFEVLEGLRSGERVVTSAYDNFKSADRLVLIQ